MNQQRITCRSQGKLEQATIYYEVSAANDYLLHFEGAGWGHLVAICYNVFDALCRLRGVLESRKCLICCNGARRDAWITRIGKEMGGGKRVYLSRLNHSLSHLDLVPTLDAANCEECVSLASQLSWHLEWMRSVLGQDYLAEDATVPTQVTHESRLRAEGVVFQIAGNVDFENVDPNAYPKSVIGAWKVDCNGNIVEQFTQSSDLPAPKNIDSSWKQA